MANLEASASPGTPQSKSQLLSPDTHPAQCLTSERDDRSQDLSLGREVVLEDLGSSRISQNLMEDGTLNAVPDSTTLECATFATSPTESEVPESDHTDRPPATRVLSITSVDVPCGVHTRAVFEDVGSPLMDIKQLGAGLACVSGITKILYHVHKAGWVHGDVSVATMRWIDKDGQKISQLMDFDYAK